MLPSAHINRLGVRVVCFRGSMATPPILYLRFAGSLAVAAQDSRPSGSLLLPCKALSSPTSCRFIPAHKHRDYTHQRFWGRCLLEPRCQFWCQFVLEFGARACSLVRFPGAQSTDSVGSCSLLQFGAVADFGLRVSCPKLEFAFRNVHHSGSLVLTSVVFFGLLSKSSEKADGICHAYMLAGAP